MKKAARPWTGNASKMLAAIATIICAFPFLMSTAQSEATRVDQIAAELSEVQSGATTDDMQQVQSVMAELALVSSEENAARVTLDILRRARTLRGDTQPIRNEEIETLVADLAEVATPKLELWSGEYRDAQAAGEAAEAAPAPEADAAAEPAAEASSEAAEEPAAETPEEEAPVEAVPAEEELVPPAPRSPEDQQRIEDSNTAIGEAMRELEEQSTPLEPTPASMLESTPKIAPSADVASEPLPKPEVYKGNPLARPVNLDFREMELSNVVALLAHMAGINVVAGTDVTGTVTANLQGVPLKQAMETALRLNGLGLVEEEGIFYIVPYEEAVQTQRRTEMLTLQNAKAMELQSVLEALTVGMPEEKQISVTANESANVLLISGPDKRISDLVNVARSLDVAEPVMPTVTEAIKINYGTPQELLPTIEKMLTKEVGQAAADERSRHIVITDQPVVVEQIRELIASLDMPVKEVMIDSMVVDVTLEDDAETGVDWIINSVRRQSRRDAALGNDTQVSDLQALGLTTDLPSTVAGGLLNFAVLSNRIDWRGMIQAEIRNLNGKLVSNPVVFTVENKPAKIEIVRDIPYVEVRETSEGGSQTNTEFKQIGTILEVTPRVTHDGFIIADIDAKESDTNGEFNGIPIEDRRSITTTMHVKNGDTIFMGGLRKRTDSTTVRKVPILGDVPVVNVLFRNNSQVERTTELLVFMTCQVLDSEQKEMTPKQAFIHEDGRNMDTSVNAIQDIWRTTVDPKGMQDPMYKFRRSE